MARTVHTAEAAIQGGRDGGHGRSIDSRVGLVARHDRSSGVAVEFDVTVPGVEDSEKAPAAARADVRPLR